VTFQFYSNPTDPSAPCKTAQTSVAAGDVQLVAGANPGEADAHPSSDEGALPAGTYGFIATFHSGDTTVWQDSIGSCEPVTVKQGTTTTATAIHLGTYAAELAAGKTTLVTGAVPLGSSVHDSATVTGTPAAFTPTGNVTFTFYSKPADPTKPCDNATTVDTKDVALDVNGVAHPSQDEGPLAPGTYAFSASYAGDGNYTGSLSDCEPLTVNKGNLSITTYIHDSLHNVVTSVPNPSTVHDTAHLTGATTGFAPDLSKVSFTLYPNRTCTAPGSDAGNNAGAVDSSTSDPRSNDQTLTSGGYSFIATFAGDGNYNPVTADKVACEPLSVRTFGKTMGFWGNTNGQARITNNGGYGAHSVTIGRGGVIDTKAESLKVLPGTLNACGKYSTSGTSNPQIFSGPGGETTSADCLVNTTPSPGINKGSLNTLAAQTLALGYNLDSVLRPGFAGQTIGALGCSVTGTSLGTGDTVDAAFTTAVGLINGSYAGSTTQAQIGAMNSLLGCINAEA
jgi:hypothetical protein